MFLLIILCVFVVIWVVWLSFYKFYCVYWWLVVFWWLYMFLGFVLGRFCVEYLIRLIDGWGRCFVVLFFTGVCVLGLYSRWVAGFVFLVVLVGFWRVLAWCFVVGEFFSSCDVCDYFLLFIVEILRGYMCVVFR